MNDVAKLTVIEYSGADVLLRILNSWRPSSWTRSSRAIFTRRVTDHVPSRTIKSAYSSFIAQVHACVIQDYELTFNYNSRLNC